jgi:hypothetical protein
MALLVLWLIVQLWDVLCAVFLGLLGLALAGGVLCAAVLVFYAFAR